MSKALERSRNTPTVVSRAKRLYLSDGLEHGTLNSFYQIQTGSDEFNHAIIHYFFKKVDHIWRIFPDITTIDVSCKNNERKGGSGRRGSVAEQNGVRFYELWEEKIFGPLPPNTARIANIPING